MGFSYGVATLLSGVEAGTFAALGCYVDVYGDRDPYPRRGPLLIAVAAGAATAFLVGSLAAADIWLTVVTLPLVAFAATFLVRASHLSGPDSYRIIVIAALSAFLPYDPGHIPLEAGYLLLGTATTWLLNMSGRLVRPFGPEESAVATACRRVADFAEAAGGGVVGERRLRIVRFTAYLAVNRAWTALGDVRGRTDQPPAPRRLVLYALLRRLESTLDAVETASWNAWPRPEDTPGVTPDGVRQLRTAAHEVAAGRTPEDFPGQLPKSGGPVTIPQLLREANAEWPVPLPQRQNVTAELRRSLSASSPAPTLALRTACAVAAGAVLGALLPLMHPSWVTVGAASALQGGPSQQPPPRARRRMVGTVIGVASTALVSLAYQPGVWEVVALVTVVHAASRTVVQSSVLLSTALSTPLALLLAYGGNPGASLERLSAYRLLDLTLGLLLGLTAAWLVPGVSRRCVRVAILRTVEATGAALRERLRVGAPDRSSAGLAWQRATDLLSLREVALTESARSPRTTDRLGNTALATRRLHAWNILSPATAPAPKEAERVREFTTALAESARTGPPGPERGPSDAVAVEPAPELPSAPALRARLQALASALNTPARPRA